MLFFFACEAAGASAPGIPHALPSERRRILAQLGRIQRRENADVCVAAEKWRRDVSAAVLPASNRFPPKYAVLLTQDESFRAQKTSSNHAFVEPRNRLSLDLKNGRKSHVFDILSMQTLR